MEKPIFGNGIFERLANNGSNSMYLGSLRVSGTGASNYLMASEPDNSPIYLNCRPSNNNITIQIHENFITQITDYAPAPVRYTLCLCFRSIE